MKMIKKAYIFNICIFALEVFSVGWMFSGLRFNGTSMVLSAASVSSFKFFTVDSNIFMGIVALILAIELKKILNGKKKSLSKFHYILALMATTGVTLTMLVTVFFLAPTFENGWVVCFSNSNMFLHAINPIVSIIAFVCYERTNRLSFLESLWGLPELCVYAVYYVGMAVTHAENGFVLPGYDFYGFFVLGLKSGYIVLPLIILVTWGISVCLRGINHIKFGFNENADNEADLLALLNSQQGEIDAVLMYQKIAEKISDAKIKELILETAADEGRHGAVFHKLTGAVLKPKKTKSILVPCLMSVLGKSRTFAIIAGQEYDAEKKYEDIVGKYPDVLEVQKDEHLHGDRMMEISNFYKEN